MIVNRREIRKRLRDLFEADRGAVGEVHSMADRAIAERIIESIGLTPADVVRDYYLAEIQKIRKDLAGQPIGSQPRLEGMDTLGEDQLILLGDDRHVWTPDAHLEHLMIWWRHAKQNADDVNSQLERKRRDLFDTGLVEYMESHPDITAGEAAAILAALKKVS